MKRIIALSLVLTVLCAAPLAAQRTRDIRTSKIKTTDAGNRFASVQAYSDGNGVLVEWKMAVETDNAGFYVHRLDGSGSAVASPEMILGSAAMFGSKSTPGEKYSFYDPEGTAGSVYYVQNLAMNGKSGVSATAAVETVGDLRAVGSVSSSELNRQVGESKRNGILTADRLRLPKTLAQEVASNRPVADDVTHAWVVSQPGAKIGVRRDGFYRVTKAELQNAGFNVNGDSSLWQLYRQGVEQAIIIGPNADYIDFWATAVDTPETDMAMYYLVSGPSAGKRIATRVARPVSGTVTSPNYSQVFQQKQRTNYLSQVLNGEAENYWGATVTTSANTTFNFNLSGVDFSSTQSTLELKFQGYSFDQHIVQVTLNGHLLDSATGNSRSPFSRQYAIPTSYLLEGANSIVFRSTGVISDFSLFDSISIGFARKHVASQNKLKFYTSNYRLSKLEGFSSPNVRVFDMTAEASPVLWTNLNVVQEGATYSIPMPADRGRSMYAVEDSGLQQAASITPNDPAKLKLNTLAANLVIIAHQNWMAEAQDWANYRTNQGFSVKVVEVSEIYDEFNYGDLSSLSIRSFLNYAEDNWQTAPSYVLFLGDASYDARNYQGLGNNNFVPTHIVTTVFLETASDEFLADFNNDGLSEMAVGRITARNGQMVTNALGKVTAFEAAAPTLQSRGALFAYDCFDSNNGYDFGQYSTALRNQLPGGTPATMIGRCDAVTPPDTPTSLTVASINAGKFVVNYSGHGTTGAWGSSPQLFTINDVPQLTNASNQSIFTMLTCLNGFFHHASNTSLAESLVQSTTGGGVAAWASTGETTPDEQNAMAARFYQRLGSGPLERIGDMINDAKTVVSGGSDVRLSWALIGDPMLKVRTATTGDRSSKR
jgi:hypothetical protein